MIPPVSTAASSSSSSAMEDVDLISRGRYIKSAAGVLKLLGVVHGLLVLILSNLDCWDGRITITFTSTLCLCGSMFFLVLHYVGTTIRFKMQHGWSFEFWCCTLYTMLYLLSGSKLVITDYHGMTLVPAVIFAFSGMLLCAAETLLLLRARQRDVLSGEYRGNSPVTHLQPQAQLHLTPQPVQLEVYAYNSGGE